LKARPIIAFSAKMDAQRAAECRAMGFDAAIQKDADLSLAVADVLLAAEPAKVLRAGCPA